LSADEGHHRAQDAGDIALVFGITGLVRLVVLLWLRLLQRLVGAVVLACVALGVLGYLCSLFLRLPSRGRPVDGDRGQAMKKQVIVPVIVLAIGLLALAIGARVLQHDWVEANSDTIALLMGAFVFGFLLVFVSTWALLSSFLPWGYSRLSAREARLGGILVALPLLVGVLNACARYRETSPLFVPLLLLNAVAGSAALWFLPFCVGHVFGREWPVLFKVFWIVLLLLGNLIAVPVYWYAFVWRPHVLVFFRRRLQGGRASPTTAASEPNPAGSREKGGRSQPRPGNYQ
jgi:hypothetical protein